jgi:hypothetical protein
VLPFLWWERELGACIFRVGEGTGCFHFYGGRGNWVFAYLGWERELGACIFRVGEGTGCFHFYGGRGNWVLTSPNVFLCFVLTLKNKQRLFCQIQHIFEQRLREELPTLKS